MRRVFAFTIFSLVFGVGIYFLVSRYRPSPSILHALLSCPSSPLSAYYHCLEPLLYEALPRMDTALFLKEVELYRKQAGKENKCHTIMHAYGRALLARRKDLAHTLRECPSTCAQGCQMGALEASLHLNEDAHITPNQATTTLSQECEKYSHKAVSPGEQGYHMNQCVHAIGHTLAMMYQDQIARVYSLCKMLPSHTIGSCLFGASMEYLLPSDAKTVHIDEHHPDSLCHLARDKEEQYACMKYLPYAWTNAGYSREKIEKFCQQSLYPYLCIQSVVERELDDMMITPDPYLFGFVSRIDIHYQSPILQRVTYLLASRQVSSDRFCPQLRSDLQVQCKQAMASHEAFFKTAKLQ